MKIKFVRNFIENDYVRHPVCECGKIALSKKDAATKRNRLIKIGKEKYLRIYQCNGTAWHLTKVKERTRKKLEQDVLEY